MRHGHGYLTGQHVQAEHWYGARPGDLCWCTAASGWSLSARNAFVAAWLRGATALLHDARFDPDERLDLLEREQVAVLCMSPARYRAIAKRASCGAAGAPPYLRRRRASTRRWCEPGRTGSACRFTTATARPRTGHLTGMPIGPPVKPGSMGRPLPPRLSRVGRGGRARDRSGDRADLLHRRTARPALAHGRPGRSRRHDSYLWFPEAVPTT